MWGVCDGGQGWEYTKIRDEDPLFLWGFPAAAGGDVGDFR